MNIETHSDGQRSAVSSFTERKTGKVYVRAHHWRQDGAYSSQTYNEFETGPAAWWIKTQRAKCSTWKEKK